MRKLGIWFIGISLIAAIVGTVRSANAAHDDTATVDADKHPEADPNAPDAFTAIPADKVEDPDRLLSEALVGNKSEATSGVRTPFLCRIADSVVTDLRSTNGLNGDANYDQREALMRKAALATFTEIKTSVESSSDDTSSSRLAADARACVKKWELSKSEWAQLLLKHDRYCTLFRKEGKRVYCVAIMSNNRKAKKTEKSKTEDDEEMPIPYGKAAADDTSAAPAGKPIDPSKLSPMKGFEKLTNLRITPSGSDERPTICAKGPGGKFWPVGVNKIDFNFSLGESDARLPAESEKQMLDYYETLFKEQRLETDVIPLVRAVLQTHGRLTK